MRLQGPRSQAGTAWLSGSYVSRMPLMRTACIPRCRPRLQRPHRLSPDADSGLRESLYRKIPSFVSGTGRHEDSIPSAALRGSCGRAARPAALQARAVRSHRDVVGRCADHCQSSGGRGPRGRQRQLCGDPRRSFARRRSAAQCLRSGSTMRPRSIYYQRGLALRTEPGLTGPVTCARAPLACPRSARTIFGTAALASSTSAECRGRESANRWAMTTS
jgi:hypothetical protein